MEANAPVPPEAIRKIPPVEKAPDRVTQIVNNLREPKLLNALERVSPENHPYQQAAAEKLTRTYLNEIPPEQRAASYTQVLTEIPSSFIMSEVVEMIKSQVDLQQNEQLLQAIGTAAERLVLSNPADILHVLISLAETNPAFVISEAVRIAEIQRDQKRSGGKWGTEFGDAFIDETIEAVSAAARTLEEQTPEVVTQVETVFATLAEVPQTPDQVGYTIKALTVFCEENPAMAVTARPLIEKLVGMKDTFENKELKKTIDELAAKLPTT